MDSTGGRVEGFYRLIVENALDVITVVGEDGTLLYQSPSARTLFGYTTGDTEGANALDWIHPDDRPQAAAEFAALIGARGGEARVLLRARRQDGSWRRVESVARNLLHEPALRGILVQSRDLTERAQADAALRESEQRYRLLFNHSPLPMWVYDLETLAFLEVNEAALRFYGYTREEFLRMTIEEIRPPEEVAALRRALGRPTPPTSDFGTWRHRKKDGTSVRVEIFTIDQRSAEGRPARLVVARDVTDLIRADEIRRRLLERAVSAQDDERRRIARELHDETGQSLAAILIGLSAIEAAPDLAEVRAAAERLRHIAARSVDELGRLARGLHPAILDDLGLATAAARFALDFAETCGVRIACACEGLGEDRLPAPVETGLYRILQEALANAGRHARAGAIRCAIRREGEDAVLEVADDGEGFDVAAVLAGGASGRLGLHSMRERAAALGGSVSVESRPGQGTTVRARIPRGTR